MVGRVAGDLLNHVKSGSLSSDARRARARQTGDRRRNRGFLDVFEQVRVCYQKLLVNEEALDLRSTETAWNVKERYGVFSYLSRASMGLSGKL